KNLILADTPELKMGIFDYQFTVGHGKEKRVHRVSVVVVQSPGLSVPRCNLRPERRFLDSIGALLGKQDIDFDEHPEFSKAFVLKSDQEEETRAFFDKGLLDYFSQHPDISFELRPGAFLYFRQWARVDPESKKLQEFLGEGFSLLEAIKERQERA
ncbi:MAG: hypothetical protein AAF483_30815, partial [Planctomycetota bacterium]